ncbi:MAG: extracellular solute-binding protein [Alphaproteobacteria bacterium]|nr:extracellular solute-binding protein [Alphaproteobacteria bacterium]TAD87366.1 MAG: extracellular solute-binding protein [Alphaproteobacteria bacterium]
MRRPLLALVAAAAVLTAVPALAQEVNIYNSRHYSSDRQLWDLFTRQTGIKVNVIDGEFDALVTRLKSEGARSPADVMIAVDAGRLAAAAGDGIFQPMQVPEVTATIPAHLRDPNDLWFGFSVRARVFIVPKTLAAADTPTSYESLADPRFRGQVLMRSGTNIYSLGLTSSVIAARGETAAETWARGVVANFARPPRGGDTDQIRAVAAGEGKIAVSNTYYFGHLGRSSRPEDKALVDSLRVVFPNQDDRGTHVNVSGVGITRTAPNLANARKLVAFFASPEAQRYLADVNMEYPANPNVAAHPFLRELGGFKADQLNAAAFASTNATARRVNERAGWN